MQVMVNMRINLRMNQYRSMARDEKYNHAKVLRLSTTIKEMQLYILVTG
jgi:hypothetical protein